MFRDFGESALGFCRAVGKGRSRENPFGTFPHVAGLFLAGCSSIAAGVHSLSLLRAYKKFDGFGIRDGAAGGDPALVGNIEFRETVHQYFDSIRPVVCFHVDVYARGTYIAEDFGYLRALRLPIGRL